MKPRNDPGPKIAEDINTLPLLLIVSGLEGSSGRGVLMAHRDSGAGLAAAAWENARCAHRVYSVQFRMLYIQVAVYWLVSYSGTTSQVSEEVKLRV